MSTMQDQPAPAQEPTSEQLIALVQQAANAVVGQLRINHRNDGAMNAHKKEERIQELQAQLHLMQLHLHMLSNLLIGKGIFTGDELNKHLIATFATEANELAGNSQRIMVANGKVPGH